MPQVVFVAFDGERTSVDGRAGKSVMESAVQAGVEGIEAECGGACSCATCHVYLDPAWQDVVGGPSALEESMLEFSEERRPESRLCCQIKLTPELDGLILHLPEHQG
jgi:2Fe-2S ferredoxin